MVFTSSASVVSRVGASSPARSALMLWRMARSSHSRASGPLDGRQRSPRFWPRPSPRGRTTEQAAALFWQFSASIKSLQRKQCIIKKWSTQAYQKAYQIRPSPLRRKWSVQVAGAKRPATLPDWRSPGGRVSKAAKPGAEQPEPRTARRASMARIASTHPLTRRWGQRPQLNKLTSGRQARPPKGGSGALPGQSFYVHKNISGYPLRGARSHTLHGNV